MALGRDAAAPSSWGSTRGPAGAYLNRRGYYNAALVTAKQFMTPDEWGYWIEGKPAEKDILSPEGKVTEK